MSGRRRLLTVEVRASVERVDRLRRCGSSQFSRGWCRRPSAGRSLRAPRSRQPAAAASATWFAGSAPDLRRDPHVVTFVIVGAGTRGATASLATAAGARPPLGAPPRVRVMRPLLLLVIVASLAESATAQSAASPVVAGGDSNAMAATTALFSMTDGFMNAVYRNGDSAAVLAADATLKLISGEGTPSDLAWDMVKVVISAYSGFAACIIIGLIFVLLMPLTGFVCCCCRFCGKCGGSVPIEDPPHAKPKRIGCGALVFIFTTVALGGAVGVFLSNQAIANLFQPSSPNNIVNHAQANLNALIDVTNSTAEGLLTNTLMRMDIAQSHVTSVIGNSGSVIVNHVLNATSVDDLLDLAGNVTRDIPALNGTLVATSNQLKEVQNLFSSLVSRLNAVKSNLSSACDAQGANANSCRQEMNIAVPRNESLDWVKPVGDAVESIVSELERLNSLSDITSKVKAANKTVIESIQSTVDQANNDAKNQFQNWRMEIGNVSTDFRNSFASAVKRVPTINTPAVAGSLQTYSDYVRFVGIAIGSFFVLLVFLSYLGLCFGTVGKRPGFDASSCNKGIGANLLLAVFGLYVILSWLLMLLTTILFLVSAAKIACMAVHEPENRLPVDRLNQFSLTIDLANLTYGDIAAGLIACKNNRSLYDAGLKKVPAVSSALDRLQMPIDTTGINRRVADLRFNGTINDFLPDNISSSVQLLDDFTTYLNNVTLGEHVSEVESQFDAINLTTIAARIQREYPDQANELTRIQNDIVIVIVQILNNLSSSMSDVRKRQPIVDRMRNLASSAVAAQHLNLTAIVHEAVVGIVDSVVSVVRQEAAALKSEVMNGSSCLPVYEQLLSTADVVCTEGLQPLSGMWFCIGWCIVVFIPSIAFSLVLVSLYRREEPYNGSHDLAEFEAQPDGFSVFHHRDNIPLESNSARNGLKHY